MTPFPTPWSRGDHEHPQATLDMQTGEVSSIPRLVCHLFILNCSYSQLSYLLYFTIPLRVSGVWFISVLSIRQLGNKTMHVLLGNILLVLVSLTIIHNIIAYWHNSILGRWYHIKFESFYISYQKGEPRQSAQRATLLLLLLFSITMSPIWTLVYLVLLQDKSMVYLFLLLWGVINIAHCYTMTNEIRNKFN